MTVTVADLGLYAFALALLVVTPGPVVVAVIAKTLGSGWRSAMPLSAGVAICDVIWPLLAILGLAALVQTYGEIMEVLRYLGGAILIWMGWRLIAGAQAALDSTPDPALLRRTAWQGFAAGFLVNISNPKAILFFVGILPNLFDVTMLAALDIALILILSTLIPLLGNVGWALSAQWGKRFLTRPKAVRRLNQTSGVALIGAGIFIASSKA